MSTPIQATTVLGSPRLMLGKVTVLNSSRDSSNK
jgi:hypothetical protein